LNAYERIIEIEAEGVVKKLQPLNPYPKNHQWEIALIDDLIRALCKIQDRIELEIKK